MVYLARRLLHTLFLLVGVSILSFLFLELAPGDYVSEMLLNPQVSPETVAAMRAKYGLDRPLPVRYFDWIKAVSHGDLGYSFAYNMPVAPLLGERARNTLVLTIAAAVLAWLLALPLGVFAAEHRGGWFDSILGMGTSTLLATPGLLLPLVLVIFAVRSGRFPVGGMTSLDYSDLSAAGKLHDLVSHAALPVIALALTTLPVLVRHVRASVLDALATPSLVTARAYGIPKNGILWRHTLRLAANPIITLGGLSIATLLSSSLLVEVIMSWPGLGPMLLEAILGRDFYVVIGTVMFSTGLLTMGNFTADALLYVVDPRTRVRP